jgi:hypothetical protein
LEKVSLEKETEHLNTLDNEKEEDYEDSDE